MTTENRDICPAHPSQRHHSRPNGEEGYRGPVAYPEVRAAHGNIRRHYRCACGATRASNVNGRHVERGPWQAADGCDRD